MKHALITHRGQQLWATAEGDNPSELRLPGGQVLPVDAVEQWLPPLPEAIEGPRSIVCLGLNYAKHAKELAFAQAPTEPLVFLKGESALVGHNANTQRPVHATHMHDECELVVVLGKNCYKVSEADALGHVLGYTVANDYAVRDDLENWYRPNLRVKNRFATTPIGPWLTDAADVPNPQHLQLQTRVNGQITQTGNTSDMVFSVAQLIAYLSQFMQLKRGDIILTGTPEGVTNCPAGSVAECEIAGLGVLRNSVI